MRSITNDAFDCKNRTGISFLSIKNFLVDSEKMKKISFFNKILYESTQLSMSKEQIQRM
jgi:hypothetical protein